MHEFDDHNELTHSFIFFWSYYNIEKNYRQVRILEQREDFFTSRFILLDIGLVQYNQIIYSLPVVALKLFI